MNTGDYLEAYCMPLLGLLPDGVVELARLLGFKGYFGMELVCSEIFEAAKIRDKILVMGSGNSQSLKDQEGKVSF
jgi:hypothetical protein